MASLGILRGAIGKDSSLLKDAIQRELDARLGDVNRGKETTMLKIKDVSGKERLIAHVREENIVTLIAIQRRFGAEVAFWDSMAREWIGAGALDFDTATDVPSGTIEKRCVHRG